MMEHDPALQRALRSSDSRPEGVHISIGCNTNFVRHDDGSLDFALEAIHHLGLRHVELATSCAHCVFATLNFCPVMTILQEAAEMKIRLQQHGLSVSQLNLYAPLVGPEATEFGVGLLLHAIRFASELGAPYVATPECTWQQKGMSDEDAFSQMRQNVRQALQVASQYGIGINLEPRGPYSATLQGTQRILELADGELASFLGLSFDIGDAYMAGEDPLTFLKGIAPRLRHLRIKDLPPRVAPDGDDTTPWPIMAAIAVGDGELRQSTDDCIRYLVDYGWSGVASLQVDGIEKTSVSVERLRATLRQRGVEPRPPI